MRIRCPYHWCAASLDLKHEGNNPQKWTNERLERSELENVSPLIIPSHPIGNNVLTGNCPASLMHYPMRPQSRHRQILDECAVHDEKKIDEWIQQILTTDPRTVNDRPESQSIRSFYDNGKGRLPGRMGREPTTSEDESDWAKGGREDEDVQPDAVWHSAPVDVFGEGVGRVSIQETLAALNDAAIEISTARDAVGPEAIQKVAGCHAALENARSSVQAAKGNVDSYTLEEYISLLVSAEQDFNAILQKMEDTSRKLAVALTLGERYSNAATS